MEKGGQPKSLVRMCIKNTFNEVLRRFLGFRGSQFSYTGPPFHKLSTTSRGFYEGLGPSMILVE